MSPSVGVAAHLESLRTALLADSSLAKGLGPARVTLLVDGVEYCVDTKASHLFVGRTGDGGAPAGQSDTSAGKSDVTLTLSAATLGDIAGGAATAQQAFAKGQLKLKGNLALALKFGALMDAARRRKASVASASPAPAPGAPPVVSAVASPPSPPSPPAPSSPAPPSLLSEAAFDDIAVALSADDSLAPRARGVYRFDITTGAPPAPAATFILDLSSGRGSVTRVGGGVPPPTSNVTLTIADADFVALAGGTMSAQQVSGRRRCAVRFSAGAGRMCVRRDGHQHRRSLSDAIAPPSRSTCRRSCAASSS